MSTYTRRPDGFRAVQYSDAHNIFYCWEQDGETHAESLDRKKRFVVEQKKSFDRLFCHEHHPDMPHTIKARFEAQSSFAEWWDARIASDGGR